MTQGSLPLLTHCGSCHAAPARRRPSGAPETPLVQQHVDLARHDDGVVNRFGAVVARGDARAEARPRGTRCRCREWFRTLRARCVGVAVVVYRESLPSSRSRTAWAPGRPETTFCRRLVEGHAGLAGFVVAGDDAADGKRSWQELREDKGGAGSFAHGAGICNAGPCARGAVGARCAPTSAPVRRRWTMPPAVRLGFARDPGDQQATRANHEHRCQEDGAAHDSLRDLCAHGGRRKGQPLRGDRQLGDADRIRAAACGRGRQSRFRHVTRP